MGEADSPRSSTPGTPEAEALCTACGLCCDGTLFATAKLTAEEARGAGARLAVVTTPAGPALRQPCVALRAGRCALYAGRPGACRAFACRLLEALGAGEVTLAEALVVVTQARERAAAFPALSSSRRAAAELKEADRAQLFALELFLDRRFRGQGPR